jgi:glycine/D-amino acid oxidase-like deaminating enzyme
MAGGVGEPPTFSDPWWWHAAAPCRNATPPPPRRADVAVVGAGITGLIAAIELALGGRQVVVLDRDAPGFGAATRNAGYVGRSLKHGIAEIAARDGLERAVRVYRELREASEAVAHTVQRHAITCHYRRQGRLLLATSPEMFDAMRKEYALRERHAGESHAVVTRAEQRTEVATDHYFGGIRIDDHAGLHPGLYHRGLLDAARRAGATVCGFAEVTGIRRDGDGFTLRFDASTLIATEVIVVTNGYAGRAWPWLQRRLIPFDAYQAVSEPLGADRLAALLPGDRTYIDWNFDVDWFRRVPDDPSRLQFGGLTGRRRQDLRSIARRLRARMLRVFPDLDPLAVIHAWTGKCAGTFDFEPRIGVHEGIHYAGGYNFVGVPMGTLFGMKLARRLLGQPGSGSAFDRPFRTMPLHRGGSWFVPLAIRWLSRHDR